MFSLTLLLGEDAEVLRDSNLQLLILANLVGPLGIALLSPVLNTLIDPFGTSAGNIGLMISVFTAPAIIAIPLIGVLSDRYGRRIILVVGLLIFGISGVSIALVTDFRAALALRFLQGIGSAAIVPVIITSIGDLYAETEEATAQGLRFASTGVSQAIFPLMAGLIVLIGWQFPFLLYAIAFPVAVIVHQRFTEPTDLDPQRCEKGQETIPKPKFESLLSVFSYRRVQLLVIARALPGVVWIGFLTYNSTIVVQLLHGSPAKAGVLAAVGSSFHAVAATQAGRITSIFESRLYPLIAAHLGLGAGFSVVLFAPGFMSAIVGVVIMGGSFGCALSFYRSIITGLVPASDRGGFVSVTESFGRLSITIAPVFMGGVITILTPKLGFNSSIQIAGLSVAIVVAIGGSACLLIGSRLTPLDYYE